MNQYDRFLTVFFITAIVLGLMSNESKAQDKFAFGLKAGVSSSWLVGKDFNSTVSNIAGVARENWSQEGKNLGYHFGGFIQLNVLGLTLQPELLYTRTSGGLKVSGFDANGNPVFTDEVVQRFNRIDLPLLIGKRFLKVLRVNAGPVASWIVSSKFDQSQISNLNLKEAFQSAMWGIQVGLGLDVGKFVVDLKYEGGLSSPGQGLNLDTVEKSINSRNNQLILSLGYKLISL